MFGLGKKKNGFFAEIKEEETVIEEKVQKEVPAVKEKAQEIAAESPTNVAELKNDKGKKTKEKTTTEIKKSVSSESKPAAKAAAPASEADRIAQLIASAVQGNGNNNSNGGVKSEDAVGFASKNFTSVPTPRRRPGANMAVFKDMANQVKVPRK